MPFDLSSLVVGTLLFMAGYWCGRVRSTVDSLRKSRRDWKPNADIHDAQIEAELRAGRKTDAIRLYRQRDGSELKQARQAVDAMIERIKTGPS